MQKKNKIHILLGLTAFVLGAFIIVQWRSFTTLSETNRDVQKNIFREIQILKETNQNLKNEVKDLNKTLDETSNQAMVLSSIEDEIEKYKMLAGEVDVVGPGITVTLDSHVDSIWLVDLVNELFNGGAEAISLNGIRLTDQTQGFEVLPQGQIFLHVSTLEVPYVFKAIGEPSELEKVVLQESGIIQRIHEKYPSLKTSVQKSERVELKVTSL